MGQFEILDPDIPADDPFDDRAVWLPEREL